MCQGHQLRATGHLSPRLLCGSFKTGLQTSQVIHSLEYIYKKILNKISISANHQNT